jgi:hypothetical protein
VNSDLNHQKQQSYHHAAFVPMEEGKKGCKCPTLKQLFPDQDQACDRGWGWNVGAEFWVRSDRITQRSRKWWENAMHVILSSAQVHRFGHESGSFASEAGYCFESVWHAILGEPFFNYVPAFRFIEELPKVSLEERMKGI